MATNNALCICCLSEEAKLIYLSSCEHANIFESLLEYSVLEEDLICIQCHSMVKKVHTFKKQVAESFLLRSLEKVQNFKSLKLNKLQISKVDLYNTPSDEINDGDISKTEFIELGIDGAALDPDIKKELDSDDEINSINIEIKQETDSNNENNLINVNVITSNESLRVIKHESNIGKEKIIDIPLKDDFTFKKKPKTMEESKKQPKAKEKKRFRKEIEKGNIFSLNKELMKSTHPKNSEYICDYCKRAFRHRGLLYRHIKVKHTNLSLPCCHCAKVFRNTITLKNHINEVHFKKGIRNTSPPKECPICHKMFKFLKVHLRRVHQPDTGGGEDRYCVECNKSYKSKHYYDLHLKTTAKHATNRYECHDCGKVFTLKNNLVAHLGRVHMKVKKYVCSICGKCFTKEYLRRCHEQHKHLGVQREKKHVCNVCGKAFVTSTTLKTHLVVHSGAKDYQCEYCPSRFGQRSTLTTHCKYKHRDAATTPL